MIRKALVYAATGLVAIEIYSKYGKLRGPPFALYFLGIFGACCLTAIFGRLKFYQSITQKSTARSAVSYLQALDVPFTIVLGISMVNNITIGVIMSLLVITKVGNLYLINRLVTAEKATGK